MHLRGPLSPVLLVSVVLAWSLCGCLTPTQTPRTVTSAPAAGKSTAAAAPSATSAPARRKGVAPLEMTRPATFPHRIWAACDFEAKLPDYGLFGSTESKNVAVYPGNTTARHGTVYGGSAQMTGCNPVPGPCMGKENFMYCRYLLRGTDRAKFQHYSLTRSDNCNVTLTGLKQGEWSEATMNFTRDSRRNDGSAEAFKEGERMDDLKVFVGDAKDGKEYELILDDIIFFSVDANLPPEKEPFPNRVIFLAGFDTGNDAKSREKYFPGEYDIVSGNAAPGGAYWSVAKARTGADAKSAAIKMKMSPPRTAGQETKLRFRYWVKGAGKIAVAVHDATAETSRTVTVADATSGKWTFVHVNFSKDGKSEKAGARPLAAGSALDELTFTVAQEGDEPVALYVDEVCVYDAGARQADKP